MAQPMIVMPQSPFVDIKTGRISLEWLVWLQNPQFITVNIAGVLGVESGGTGQTSPLTNGQLLIGSSGSSGLVANTLTPVSNQTTVANAAGSITIGTVQDIGTTSSPAFSGLSITGNAGIANLLINSPVDDTASKLQVQGAGRTTGDFTCAAILQGGAVVSQSSLTISDTIMIKSNTTFTNGAGASLGTITNAPSAGNPTKWIGIDDNGVTRYIPAW